MKHLPVRPNATAMVDDADYERLAQHKWRLNRLGYAHTSTSRNPGPRKYPTMHRMVLQLPDDMDVDHIDGNKLNNTRANLRPATAAQNSQNRKKPVGGRSRFNGVVWNQCCRKWQAQIGVGGRRIYLGLHVHEEDAARAYDAAARQHYGEYARLNFEDVR